MIRRSQVPWLVRLALALSLFAPFARLADAAPATPVAQGTPAARGTLDVAAAALTPADTDQPDAYGLIGGVLVPDPTAPSFVDLPPLLLPRWTTLYSSWLGSPAAANDIVPAHLINSFVIVYPDTATALRGYGGLFAHLMSGELASDIRPVTGKHPVGAQSALVRFSAPLPTDFSGVAPGQFGVAPDAVYKTLWLLFRADDLVGGVRVYDSHKSPNAAETERLAAIYAQRLVTGPGASGWEAWQRLDTKMLSLPTGPGAAEEYTRLAETTLPYYALFEDANAFAIRDRVWDKSTAVYEMERFFPADGITFTVLIADVFAFAKAKDAAAYLRDGPDKLRPELIPMPDAKNFGDESRTFTVDYSSPSQPRPHVVTGARVGTVVVFLELVRNGDPATASAQQLMANWVKCLKRDSCTKVVRLPADMKSST